MGISGAAWNYRIECVGNGSLSSSVFSKSIKNFAVLRHPFVHSLSRHRLAFLAVVAAYNIDVVLHPLVDWL